MTLSKRFYRPIGYLVLAALALVPTALTIRAAHADDEEDGAENSDEEAPAAATRPGRKVKENKMSPAERAKRRKEVLAGMLTDENVLINITESEMPSSPDIVNLGKRAAKPLARCLADNVDDGLRVSCAYFLGATGDTSVLPVIHGALEAWNPSVRTAAISALRSMPHASNVEPLLKIIEREDESAMNVISAYRALGATAAPKAIKVLRAALRKNEGTSGTPAIHDAAFDGLWRSRTAVAREALISDVEFALRSKENNLVNKGTRAAAELREPKLVGTLTKLLTHADVRVRNNAVYALGKIGDKTAASSLLAYVPKVREARMLNNIAFALERIDPKSFFATAEQLSAHKQASIRMNTAFVLGDVRRSEGLPLLQKALSDKNDTVRFSAVHALGKIDGAPSQKMLEKFVNDPNPTFRHAAIYGLFQTSGRKRVDLLWDNFFQKGKPEEKREAGFALIEANDPRLVDYALTCLEKRQCGGSDEVVKSYLLAAKGQHIPGRILLNWVSGSDEYAPLVAKLKPEGAAPLAVSVISRAIAHENTRSVLSAVDVVAALKEGSAKPALERVAEGTDPEERVHALLALGSLGDTKADAKVLADFDGLAAVRLGHYARTLGEVTQPTVKKRLEPELKKRSQSKDVRTAIASAKVLFAWDPESGIYRLVDALASTEPLEREMAFRILRNDDRPVVTSLIRRSLAREGRPVVRDALRVLSDARE
jgi:HEAT repeat protein